MHPVLDEIAGLLEHRGAARYGREKVSQLEHALQCATLAEREGATPPLVAASLLHDLGHLVHERHDGDTLQDVDDVHQFLAIPFLRGVFDEAVLAPMRLHVDAKRYLCYVDSEYPGTLSAASVASLATQGGPFDAAESAHFVDLPFSADAVRLRLWDDRAKVAGLKTPPLRYFMETLRPLVLR